MNCNSVESAKAPVCNILSRSECKPKHECLFHSLDRSRTGSFISPFIQKCYSLILMVLCYNMITFHDYVFLWLVCKFFMRNRMRFLLRYLSSHRSMLTKLLEKMKRKNKLKTVQWNSCFDALSNWHFPSHLIHQQLKSSKSTATARYPKNSRNDATCVSVTW